MKAERTRAAIDLRDPLSLATSWRFPLQSSASRRDLVIGGLWLMVPVFGWLMNMGHRIVVVHRIHRREAPWPAWQEPRQLLKHGAITFLGMAFYGWPGVGLAALGVWLQQRALLGAGFGLWLLAVIAIPGYMSHYCKEFDAREIFHPLRALDRVRQGGLAYWRAWSIVLPTMLFSSVGLLAGGVGFLFTSVWFWQVAAFSFATVFTQRFGLDVPRGAQREWLAWSVDPLAVKHGVSFDRTPAGRIAAPPGLIRVCAYHIDHDERPTCYLDVATLQEAVVLCDRLREHCSWNVDVAAAFDDQGACVHGSS